MNELTYIDIIKGKGLKQYRNENNLNIPIEYIKSTQKIIIVNLLFGCLIGLTTSLFISN